MPPLTYFGPLDVWSPVSCGQVVVKLNVLQLEKAGFSTIGKLIGQPVCLVTPRGRCTAKFPADAVRTKMPDCQSGRALRDYYSFKAMLPSPEDWPPITIDMLEPSATGSGSQRSPINLDDDNDDVPMS